MLEASRRCRILLPRCTSIKFAALGPDRDFFIAALAEGGKSHRNFYEISLRCKGSGAPFTPAGFSFVPLQLPPSPMVSLEPVFSPCRASDLDTKSSGRCRGC